MVKSRATSRGTKLVRPTRERSKKGPLCEAPALMEGDRWLEIREFDKAEQESGKGGREDRKKITNAVHAT